MILIDSLPSSKIDDWDNRIPQLRVPSQEPSGPRDSIPMENALVALRQDSTETLHPESDEKCALHHHAVA